MNENIDSKGNIYFNVKNIRVTVLHKTWNGSSGIRIQAYKGKGSSMFQGAELPIPDKNVAFDLLVAIHKAYECNEQLMDSAK